MAESVAEARPLEIAMNSVTIELEVAESCGEGEAGSSWSRTTCTTGAAATTATQSVGDARPPECAQYSAYAVACKARVPAIAKHSARTESELAESSGGAGPSWSRAHGATSVGVGWSVVACVYKHHQKNGSAA